MSLVTGERISCAPGFWTELPITDAAIAQVHAIAIEEGQPLLQNKNLIVEWHPKHEVDKDKYDKDYQPDTTEHDEDDSLIYDDNKASTTFALQSDLSLRLVSTCPPNRNPQQQTPTQVMGKQVSSTKQSTPGMPTDIS